jgi:DNA-binding MarR family transcriptional regulator
MKKRAAAPSSAADDSWLDEHYSVRLSRLKRLLMSHTLLRVKREYGINVAEYRTLQILGVREALSTRDISEAVDLDKAQVVRAAAGLIRRGLAVQTIDGNDRRLRALALTERGRRVYEEMAPFARGRQERLAARLTPVERGTFERALAKLVDEADRMLAEERAMPPQHARAPKRGPDRSSGGRRTKTS